MLLASRSAGQTEGCDEKGDTTGALALGLAGASELAMAFLFVFLFSADCLPFLEVCAHSAMFFDIYIYINHIVAQVAVIAARTAPPTGIVREGVDAASNIVWRTV